jgi:hypothetical protein
MEKRLRLLLLTTLWTWVGIAHAGPDQASEDRVWNFTVYLDDDPVGHHRFTLNESRQRKRLQSEARFSVKLLMIEAYRYQHKAQESWDGDCLSRIEAETDDNGEQSSLSGLIRGGRFELNHGRFSETLPGCIMTFAYWNPLILEQSRLLNPQTGDFTPVTVSSRGEEPVTVRGKKVNATHYHLDARKFQIDLWYSDGKEWVALDSALDNGRLLHYRIE